VSILTIASVSERLSVRTFCSVLICYLFLHFVLFAFLSDCFVFAFWFISLNSFDSVFDLFYPVFVRHHFVLSTSAS
jgi:nitrate reductase NapE component